MRRLHTLVVPVLLLIGSVLTTGCATDRQIIGQANQMHSQLDPAVIEDPELAGYLQQVGERIIGTAKDLSQQGYGPKAHKSGDSQWMFGKEMRFHFVNSKTMNAFTTGGEHMYIYTQLFLDCQSEDELAAVMAHEYAHIYGRHVAKGMNRQYGALAAAAALGAGGYYAGGKEQGATYAAAGAGLGMAAASFINMGFTRSDEAEADKLGYDFYVRSGWDPEKFDDFFQHMIDKGFDKTPAIMSDHPTLASRVQDAQRRTKELPASAKEWRRPPVASPNRFRDLQQRAVALGKTLPDDTTLANAQQLARALPRSCVVPYETKDEVEAREEIVQKAQAEQAKQEQAAAQQPAAAKKRKKRPPATPATPQPAPAQPASAQPASGSQVIGRS